MEWIVSYWILKPQGLIHCLQSKYPMYEPLEVAKFKKFSRVLVKPKELIDFWKTEEKYHD